MLSTVAVTRNEAEDANARPNSRSKRLLLGNGRRSEPWRCLRLLAGCVWFVELLVLKEFSRWPILRVRYVGTQQARRSAALFLRVRLGVTSRVGGLLVTSPVEGTAFVSNDRGSTVATDRL